MLANSLGVQATVSEDPHPKCHIVALGHEINISFAVVDLNMQLRIALHERRQKRREPQSPHCCGQSDPQIAAKGNSADGRLFLCIQDEVGGYAQSTSELPTRIRQANLSSGSLDQTHAETAFE